MKRILILFIVLLLVLPIFAFPVSAENEYTAMTIFCQDKYYVEILGDDAFRTELINAIVEHTKVPYSYSEENDFGTINFVRDPEIEEGIYYVESKRLWITDYGIIFVCNEKPIKELIEEFSKQIKIQTAYDGSSAWVVDVTSFKALYEEDDNGEKAEEEKKKDEDEASVFETIKKFFDWEFISMDSETIKATLLSGGFNYINNGSELNEVIDAVYKALYPIGFATMLLCWGFGIAKSSISSALDVKDKSSIIHSVISLIIGVAAMSLAPQILTILASASGWLCNSIFDQNIFTSFIQNISIEGVSIQDFLYSLGNQAIFTSIVLLVVSLIFMINILWLALLQCLSPIFIGLMANQSTRKISFNFIKEYFKALLVPTVTLIYFFLAFSFTGASGSLDLIVAIVLAISTLGIAGKKLDKLIN